MSNIQRSNSWFLDQLAVFQTANSDYQSVKNNFIIRKTEFSTIVDSIQNKKAKDPLQHELILGRRGSGKSTLLKRIEIEVVENPRLNKKFVPINLAEEQAGIYRLFDLWEQVLEELKIQTKAEISIPEYAAFDDVQAYTRQLYNSIHDVCLQSKKRIILLLDNFDRIVENLDDDGSLLRETLINYNDIQIIAGSTRMDEHFWGYDKPFYEFFRRHRLEALSREEINLLLNHWSDSLEIPILRTFVKDNPGKIENIRLLTDGLPRTLQFFIQIVLQKSETSTYDYLKKTMDNVSPLFQERLNALTAPMRKIVLEMAFIWEACSTKQLVEKTRMESKLISANLSTLVDKGLVDKIETNKKQHLYRISERFFNMWLIVTQGNPEQKRKARWLSIFLENWYDATDFKRLTGEHISKLPNGETDWFQALVFSKALSQSKYISLEERDTIIDLTESLKCKGAENCLIELPERYTDLQKKINRYFEVEDYDKVIDLLKNIENEADGHKFILLGIVYAKKENYSEAEQYFQLAEEKGLVDALFALGLLYEEQKNLECAKKYYLQSVEKGNNTALFNLARIFDNQDNEIEAEKYYLMAVEHGDKKALNNLAFLYLEQEKYSDSEKYYQEAINKGDESAIFYLGLLNAIQSKFAESEKLLRLAIEKKIFESDAVHILALSLQEQKRFSEAEDYLLLSIDKGNPKAINDLAVCYHAQNKYSEAEKYFLIALENGNNEGLNDLAYLYYQTNTNKAKALEYINLACSLKKEPTLKETLITIELWNGIFNDVENRIISIATEKNGENLEEFIIDLLVQQQKNLVLRLFQNAEFGAQLQERYMVLYYVTLLLTNPQDENLRLRIPPELQSTIDEVLGKIINEQKRYSGIA